MANQQRRREREAWREQRRNEYLDLRHPVPKWNPFYWMIPALLVPLVLGVLWLLHVI